MSRIVTSPERVRVGYVPPCERWRFSPGRGDPARRGRRARIDRAGPTLLFLLLCSAFVPSVLTEFDVTRLLKVLQDIVVAIGQPSTAFVSGDRRPPAAPSGLAVGSLGPQAADSAAAVCDGRPVDGRRGSRASFVRRPAIRRRRPRGDRQARAPPPLSSSRPFQDGIDNRRPAPLGA